jgi:hypothetical protein
VAISLSNRRPRLDKRRAKPWKRNEKISSVATPAGIEPATFSLEGTCGCCSINVHSDKSTLFRAIEPKRLSAAVRMKANDPTGQSFPSPPKGPPMNAGTK